jgi:DNA polymerase-3 subunit epsilon
MYSIIDLETTGFSPMRGDKIVEVGIVKVQEDNKIIDEFSTLVNPNRDISNSQIHGVKPNLVKNAPKFDEIRKFIKSFINGSTLVAHNAAFDLRFLENELMEQKENLNAICTIKLSRMLDSTLPCRKLDVLCEYYDIEIKNSHQALSDTLATTKLFSKLKSEFYKLYGAKDFKQKFVSPVSFRVTDNKNVNRLEYKRTEASKNIQNEKTKLQEFISRLPTDSITKKENSKQYLDTLNEILLDRIITNTELNELEGLVTEFSVTKAEIIALNKQYLAEVIKVYLLDDKISNFELKDLKIITELLGLKQVDLDNLIESVKQENKVISAKNYKAKNKVEGKSICFTGQLKSKINGSNVSRSLAQNIAQQHGMVIKKNVSKKLDYLVTADPATMSGKAKKARKYDVKILAEPEFWRLIAVNVQ